MSRDQAIAGSPLVSVIVPTHNRPEFLAEALASVRKQIFAGYEIIVVSNGESEEMRSKSQALAATNGARYFELRRGNVCAARNFGIVNAAGEWIALLDDDDIWLPRKLERQVSEAKLTNADMIVVDYIEFNSDGQEILRQPRLLEGWGYTRGYSNQIFWSLPSGVLVRKSALIEAGLIDTSMRCSEDNDMWRRFSWHHKIHEVHEILLRYRQGHASMYANRRACFRYDLWHFVKMRFDTPDELRSELPDFWTFVPPRLVGIFAADWMLEQLHRIQPRRRMLNFRRWLRGPHPHLRPHTQLKHLVEWLQWIRKVAL
jgi:glycosyltransferase involved in cell wall biosynthesis